MKKILSVFLGAFFLFILLGAKGSDEKSDSQDVLKELDDFQRSLSNWMKNLDTLGNQVLNLQKSVGDSLTPLKDFDKSMKSIEEKLNAMALKVDVVEKTASIAEVKNMLESFGKTFDVFKKLLSDLTKRVEDQEIKASVLEKRYQEAQRPLEPIKKAIDDLGKLVNDKLGEQEKKFSAIEDMVKTRLASTDTAIKSFEGQIKTLSDMDTRMKRLEKSSVGSMGLGTATVTAEATPALKIQATSGTETAKTAVGTETVAAAKEKVTTPEDEGYKDIGDGFYIRNVNLYLFGSSSQIKGDIKNYSDKDWSIATFVIRVYNASNFQLFTQDFSIKTFKKGEVRTFNEIISGYSPLDIARYEVESKRRY
ncbi:MAG TPA: hypothetical protein ACFYDZ_05635 [Candidatus Brocadiaceae bacterium]